MNNVAVKLIFMKFEDVGVADTWCWRCLSVGGSPSTQKFQNRWVNCRGGVRVLEVT